MVTEADPRSIGFRAWARVCTIGLLACLPFSSADGLPSLAQAEALYDAGQYAAAAAALEQVVEQAPELAHARYLLGMSNCRLAERTVWIRAVVHARRCGSILERAVALDPHHRGALRALARFYAEAPAVVGGDPDKAAQTRARLEALPVD